MILVSWYNNYSVFVILGTVLVNFPYYYWLNFPISLYAWLFLIECNTEF